MKYFLACLFLWVFHFNTASAQNLALEDLNGYIGQTVFKVNESLKSKGWVLHPELSGEQQNQLYKTFAFGNAENEQGKAISWFRLHADNQMVNQLYYQLPGKAELENLVAAIIAGGAQKKNIDEISNEQLSSYYIGYDLVYQTITGKDSYTLMVVKKPLQD